MDPSRGERLQELVKQAQALPPDSRSEFLEEACQGDDALRAEVESLLRDGDDVAEHVDVPSEARPADMNADASNADGASFTGRTIAHYRIHERLGAGGMGVVYKAQDLRLERFAALKFLPPQLSADADARERFVAEAKAASALDHQNICTIYEIGESADDRLFIAMAYYRGETLRRKIERGPLSVEEAVDYAAQIAEGLARAHEAGIVHRDVKPANIMLTDEGVAKILDFGIAKMRDVHLTGEGMTPGTMAYMSPEQVRGLPVDQRSDIWSLGVLLHEMLTGERPFRGEYDQAILYSILHDEPKPIDLGSADSFEGLETVIEDCLRKDPDLRISTMEEVSQRLRALGKAPVAGGPSDVSGQPVRLAATGSSLAGVYRTHRPALLGAGLVLGLLAIGAYAFFGAERVPVVHEAEAAGVERSIAVLPFTYQGGGEDDAYFADGVTDDILTHLSMVPDFSVISRTTSMLYRGSEERASAIAGELEVRYILQGSVRRAGDRVRITSQLIDGQTDQNIWAQTYDRQLEDVFAVQTDIARSIADALETELSSGVEERIQRPPTEDLEAYDLFLVGRENFFRYDAEGAEQAIDSFRAALQRDPEFALARAWLGRAYGIYAFNHGAGSVWADSAIVVSREAAAQQPDLAIAYTALGTALMGAGQTAEAVDALERALELNPNDAAAMTNLGVILGMAGRWDEGIRHMRQSLLLEPSSSYIAYLNLGEAYIELGLYDQAEQALDRSLNFRPGFSWAIFYRAWLNFLRGDHDAVVQVGEELLEQSRSDARIAIFASQALVLGGEDGRAREAAQYAYELNPTVGDIHLVGVLYGYTLERAGEAERARALYAESEAFAVEQIEAGNETNSLYYSLACVHALRGEVEEALQWLTAAMEVGWNREAVTRHDPLLASLRGEPRFEALLDEMSQELEAQRERVVREGL